ncbi:hypothetical protein ACT3SQ_15130 [Brachybacterium sp. AOP42-C2-15]
MAFSIFAGIATIGFLATVYFAFRSTGTESFAPIISRVEDAGPEAAAYLVSFVFPFLVTQQPSGWQEIAMYVIFSIIYILVLSGTNMIAINPLFFMLGLKIWRVESEDFEHSTSLLIGRRRPEVGNEYRMSGRHGIYLSIKERTT